MVIFVCVGGGRRGAKAWASPRPGCRGNQLHPGCGVKSPHTQLDDARWSKHRLDHHRASDQLLQLFCQIPLKSTFLWVSPRQSMCLSDRYHCCFLNGSEAIDNICCLKCSPPTHLSLSSVYTSAHILRLRQILSDEVCISHIQFCYLPLLVSLMRATETRKEPQLHPGKWNPVREERTRGPKGKLWRSLLRCSC